MNKEITPQQEHSSSGILSTENGEATFVDPGVAEHRPRQADIDERAAKRAEIQTVTLFAISIIGTIVMIWAYFALPPAETVTSMRNSNFALGIGLFLSLFGIGTAAVHWAKSLMNDHEKVDAREPLASDEETRRDAVALLAEGAEDSGIKRRSFLKVAFGGALALFPLTIAVPLVGSVGGDWNVSKLKYTWWKQGTRLVTDPDGRPIRAADVTAGSAFHVIPADLDEAEHFYNEKAKAVVFMVRIPPEKLIEEEARKTWSHEGIVAYSKICTHVGCPVALYEQQTHHLLCPCHQSTFDMADGAKVVFGPAKRALPQLPITIDDEGYLIAQSDFTEPIGPSFWERLK